MKKESPSSTPYDEAEIEAALAPLLEARNRIRDEKSKRESAALVGRCFKYRNSYSCPKEPSDYWWMYTKVVSVGEYWPVALEFQTDKDGQITIATKECFHRLGGHDEISVKEFNAAWRKLQQSVARMKP